MCVCVYSHNVASKTNPTWCGSHSSSHSPHCLVSHDPQHLAKQNNTSRFHIGAVDVRVLTSTSKFNMTPNWWASQNGPGHSLMSSKNADAVTNVKTTTRTHAHNNSNNTTNNNNNTNAHTHTHNNNTNARIHTRTYTYTHTRACTGSRDKHSVNMGQESTAGGAQTFGKKCTKFEV